MQTDRERAAQASQAQEKPAPFPIPERIPIFALPNVVFFPKTYLPLHIFEPRYRKMVADASLAGQCIGMALLKDGWEADYYGHPPVYPIGCVGRLVSVQPLPDGRSNILLQGLERYEIAREWFEQPYREATVTMKPQPDTLALDPAMRQRLFSALKEYFISHEQPPTWQDFFREDVSDEILVNTLSTYLDCTPLEKQFLLEADSLQQRAGRLNDLLQFIMHDRQGSKGWG